MRLFAKGVLFGIAACWATLCWEIVRAAPPEADGSATGAVGSRFYSLFNGQDFQRWQHADGWNVVEGAFYRVPPPPVVPREVAPGVSQIIGGYQGDPDLHYVAARMPTDFELAFQWKEFGARAPNSPFNPCLEIDYNRANYPGAGLDYRVSGTTIRLHTRGAGAPPIDIGNSGISRPAQAKDFSAPVGQWNQSRILCKGSRVQFRLNGNLVHDMDFQKPNNHIERLAAADWIKYQQQGMYLSVIAPPAGESPQPVVQIRSINVRQILATEQLSP